MFILTDSLLPIKFLNIPQRRERLGLKSILQFYLPMLVQTIRSFFFLQIKAKDLECLVFSPPALAKLIQTRTPCALSAIAWINDQILGMVNVNEYHKVYDY